MNTKKYAIKKSDIAGKGVFAKRPIKKGEVIGTAMMIDTTKKGENQFKRTLLGRFINDAKKKNAQLKKEKNKVKLIAHKNIEKGDEIVSDYREAEKILQVKIKRDWE